MNSRYVVLDQGSILVHSNRVDVSLHGQLIWVADCFLDIGVMAGKISAGKEMEYLDHLTAAALEYWIFP